MRVYVGAPYASAWRVRKVHDLLKQIACDPVSHWAELATEQEHLHDSRWHMHRAQWEINVRGIDSCEAMLVLSDEIGGGELFAEVGRALLIGRPVLWTGPRRILSCYAPGVLVCPSLEDAMAQLARAARAPIGYRRDVLLAPSVDVPGWIRARGAIDAEARPMICPNCFEPIEDDDTGECACVLDGLGTSGKGVVKPKAVNSSPMREMAQRRWDTATPAELAVRRIPYGQRSALERVAAGLPIKSASHTYLHGAGFIEGPPGSATVSALGAMAVGVLKSRKRGGKGQVEAPAGGE